MLYALKVDTFVVTGGGGAIAAGGGGGGGAAAGDSGAAAEEEKKEEEPEEESDEVRYASVYCRYHLVAATATRTCCCLIQLQRFSACSWKLLTILHGPLLHIPCVAHTMLALYTVCTGAPATHLLHSAHEAESSQLQWPEISCLLSCRTWVSLSLTRL